MGLKPRAKAGANQSQLIIGNLERFLAGVLRLGGEGELRAEPVLAAHALDRDWPDLPAGAAEFFTTVAGALHLHWSLDDDAADKLTELLGDDFEECRYGGIDLRPESFEYFDIDTWAVADDTWRNKAAFSPAGNGDYLGVDLGATPGQIVFLSHELDPDCHGKALGSSLVDLLLRWSPLGCIGPEEAQWSPFLAKTGRYLDPRSPNAKRFLAYVLGAAGGADWKQAKTTKYAKLIARVSQIAADGGPSLDAMTKTIAADGYGKKLPARFSKWFINELGSWFGTSPSPELERLLAAMTRGEPGGTFGELKTRIPARLALRGDNAFVQALTDRLLLDGAFANMCPIGGAQPWDHYFAEVGEGSAVFTSRPSSAVKFRAASLPHFAQLLQVAEAFGNVDWYTWNAGDPQHAQAVAAFAPLAPHLSCVPRQEKNRLDDFIATFGGARRAAVSHPALTRLERSRGLRACLRGEATVLEALPVALSPADLAQQPCGDALRSLLHHYLIGPDAKLHERISAAEQHPARLVRDAATLVDALVGGVGPRHPARHLSDLRRLCRGESHEPITADDSAARKALDEAADEGARARADLVRAAKTEKELRVAWHDLAYYYSQQGHWAKLLRASPQVIVRDPSDGWRYRGRALAGLGRHDDAIEAFNRSLLYPAISRSDAYPSRLASVLAAGDTSAARAHVDWLAPTARASHGGL